MPSNLLLPAAPANLAARFGGEMQLNLMARRFANIFKVDWEQATRWPDVFGALLQAAQWSWEYGAMPSRHIWLLPFNTKEKIDEHGKTVEIWRKTYSVADSFEWRIASADQKTQETKRRYVLDTPELPTADLPALLARLGLINQPKHGGAYHKEDIGYKSRVLFLDDARQCKELGLPYTPPYHYGFWRVQARQNNDKTWEPDNVPIGRTRQWVAVKRAEKSALAEHFELRPLPGWQRHDDRATACQRQRALCAQTGCR